jgi:hypothetical protein
MTKTKAADPKLDDAPLMTPADCTGEVDEPEERIPYSPDKVEREAIAKLTAVMERRRMAAVK